jgi:brefeldin A-inhibited guanine nucleotide-exchange protein
LLPITTSFTTTTIAGAVNCSVATHQLPLNLQDPASSLHDLHEGLSVRQLRLPCVRANDHDPLKTVCLDIYQVFAGTENDLPSPPRRKVMSDFDEQVANGAANGLNHDGDRSKAVAEEKATVAEPDISTIPQPLTQPLETEPEPASEPETEPSTALGEDDNGKASAQPSLPTSPPPVPAPDASDSTNAQPSPIRGRTDSQSTTATTPAPGRPLARSSVIFVISSLESIAATRDARRNKQLSEALARALAAVKSEDANSKLTPELLFEALQLATQTPNVQVVTTALDCIGKLISYSFFAAPIVEHHAGEQDEMPLIERAIDTICDCFQSEATPVETQLQIVKSLLAAILNDKIVVHGAGLLKAVRMTYQIFLLSKSSANQTVAQGALTQMVGTVFERVKQRLEQKELRVNSSRVHVYTDLAKNGDVDDEDDDGDDINDDVTTTDDLTTLHDGQGTDADETETVSTAPSDVPVGKRDTPKITLQSFENRKSFDDAKITEAAPTVITRVRGRKTPSRTTSGYDATSNGTPDHAAEAAAEDEEDEIFIRDAYLVFRAMCRLTTKALPVEHALDVKSQAMRSKLISLHIIYTILANHTVVFVSPYSTIRSSSNDQPTSFVQAIKQYLCLSLSRNGASSVKPVFEVNCEIFWLMLNSLRVMLKKEIEVFLKEIYLAILEKKSAPAWQKQLILGLLARLAASPRALVEVYLNYDCDRTALDNMFERIVEHLSRMSSTPVPITPVQLHSYLDQAGKGITSPSDWHHRTLPPSLATVSLQKEQDTDLGYPAEYGLKLKSLEVIVETLRSLLDWSSPGLHDAPSSSHNSLLRASQEGSRESFDRRDVVPGASPRVVSTDGTFTASTPVTEDDPSQFDREKQRKTAMASAIRQFNFKPKRGIKSLLAGGFIKSDSPEDMARFLFQNDLIHKAPLGEFLGEGEDENIKIMHAFVDLMDFRQMRFVDAIRRFLQSFRLPGEAQKIDRFMLKFAERYIHGNPNAFANADTAYTLAYSVIMLNTDLYSTKIRGRRMTPEDFIKNNRGINDSADLPDDYIRSIYEDIAASEIVLFTERETAANLGQIPQPSQGLAATIGQAVANAGRDYRKEEYAQTEVIANRTEQLYKNLLRAQRRAPSTLDLAKFVPATSFKHVGPMFHVTWMPFLTALSGVAQETNSPETIKLCMEGLKLAVRISCLFDLEDPRQAFVSTLSRFTNLYNLSEMKAKNLEALKTLLDVAVTERDMLKTSWRDILTCISQLDRFQLISTGVDEGAVPDVLRRHSGKAPSGRRNLNVPKGHRGRTQSGIVNYHSEIAEESRSADIIRAVDKIFTNTEHMSGEGIIYFVKALTQVSWQEIESSGQSEYPRTYSLQKIVEISGYNMTRVRFQWANIWQILGQHFNQVGCHTNTRVVEFALNSLRQLSMRFLEIEELPGFKFQKDFLKPFEHIIANSTVVNVKDLVLRCLIQMIQAQGDNIRSGWRTMFGVFTVAARENYGQSTLSHYPVYSCLPSF